MLFSKENLYLVTGASSGIGRRCAVMLCDEGASVIAIGRNRERLLETQNLSENPKNMYIEVKDLTDDMESLPGYVSNLKEKYGKFSGLVACAGITAVEPFIMLQYETMKNIFNANYFSQIMLLKGFVDKRNLQKENVSIVAITSMETSYLEKGMALYSASKSALEASCKVIAKEYASKGIRINMILPSDVDTPMTAKTVEVSGNRADKYPLGLTTTEDVGNMALYLLSDKSKHITGAKFEINGGLIV